MKCSLRNKGYFEQKSFQDSLTVHEKCLLVVKLVHDNLLSSWRVVKGIFVTRDRPFFFPVKCEMAIVFFVNRDFYSSREA